jgi:hypothetical protein
VEIFRRSCARALWLVAGAIATASPGVALAQSAAASPHGAYDTSHYRVLGADNNRIAIVNAKGEIEWEIANDARATHDIQLLPNGNILFHTGWTTIKEVNRAKEVVWKYEVTAKPGYNGKYTLHAFERLANGRTMIAESGNQRIIEVDKDGRIVHEIPLIVDKPSATSDTRMVRSVPGGGYLVAHEADGKIREYDRAGKVVWEYALQLNDRPASPGATGHGTMPFGVLRLKNGNTLIGGGNNNRVLEVNRAGEIVWSVEAKDLPGISLAWVSTVDALPNGNVIFGNSHAGPDNPQLIEVTRDKRVVWTFKNFDVFGNNLVAAKVLRSKN